VDEVEGVFIRLLTIAQMVVHHLGAYGLAHVIMRATAELDSSAPAAGDQVSLTIRDCKPA
jgi:hypothetical protein